MNSLETAMTIKWIALFVILGIAALPLALTLLRRLEGAAFFFVKPLGLLISGYVTWIIVSLGIMEYSLLPIIIGLVFLALLSMVCLLFYGKQIWENFKRNLVAFIIAEMLFVNGFLGVLVMRSYDPDIYGSEKEADFAFINSTLNAKTFPPEDPWCAGEKINYYYFGHYLSANLMKLADTPSNFGYNFALAVIGGLSACGAFGAGFMFVRRVWAGFLSLACLLFMGNYYSGYLWFMPSYFGNVNVYWDPSRDVIKGIIHEFPYFSFLLGDLHPHLIAMPFSLTLLALLGALARAGSEAVKNAGEFLRGNWPILLASALFLGVYFPLHTWDVPAFGLLFAGALFISLGHFWRNADWLNTVLCWGLSVLAVGGLAVVLFLPYHSNLIPQYHPLQLVAAKNRSSFFGFYLLNGFFMIMLMLFFFGEIRRRARSLFEGLVVTWSAALLFAFSALLVDGVFAFGLAGGALIIWFWIGRTYKPEDLYASALAFLVLGIYLGCELIFVWDIYNDRPRINTCFKFYYLNWIFLSALTPWLVKRFLGEKFLDAFHGALHKVGTAFAVLFALSLGMPYFFYGTQAKIPWLSFDNKPAVTQRLPTLDGHRWMLVTTPGDYWALDWMKKNIPPGTVVLEDSGPSTTNYGNYDRFSAHTGNPTILGWHTHEYLWREIIPPKVERKHRMLLERLDDVDHIYGSENKIEILPLLRKYKVEYIIVGEAERREYKAPTTLRVNHLKFSEKALSMETFMPIADCVYNKNGVTIYRVRK